MTNPAQGPPSPDEALAILDEELSAGSNIDHRTRVFAACGVLLYWVGYELNRMADQLSGVVDEAVSVQDETSTVSSEGPEEGSTQTTGVPVDADAQRQNED